jgi:hypothetical protein
VAKLLALASVACLAGLQYGFFAKEDEWEALTFALLYHGALASAVLSCALAWRHEDKEFRYTSRLLLVIVALVWAYTWFEPLQDLVAWVKLMRFLWLEV